MNRVVIPVDKNSTLLLTKFCNTHLFDASSNSWEKPHFYASMHKQYT